MKRLLTLITATLVGNSIALIVADVGLSKVSLQLSGFLSALIVFTLVSLLLVPVLRSLFRDRAPAITGLSTLIATLISLVVTVNVSDGLRIGGSLTWLLAALVVWIVSALLNLVIVRALGGEAPKHRDAD